MSTIAREFTKEQLQQIIETDHVQCGEASSLARIALASLEVEPVAYMYKDNLHADARFSLHTRFGNWSQEDINEYEITEIPLYTAPPAPVSVPDLKPVGFLFVSDDGAVAYSPADWPMKGFNLIGQIYGDLNACRAAMLQGADVSLTHEGKNHHEDKLGMVNHLGDVTEKVEPVTQIEPVADLYGLTSPTGGETSFTFDAVEARDFIDGGWSCQEYVELERFQEAVSGNSPVIQDGWVAVPVEPTIAILDEFDSIIDYGAEDSKDAWSRLLAAAWIKSLPAAPQQEVESQIRKGKTVAREEWELGARLTKHRFKP